MCKSKSDSENNGAILKHLAQQEYQKEYRAWDYAKLHRQKWLETKGKHREWLEKNPDYFKKKCKEWRKKHPDYAKECSKEFHQEHPEYHRTYRNKNRKKLRKYWRDRKRKERMIVCGK